MVKIGQVGLIKVERSLLEQSHVKDTGPAQSIRLLTSSLPSQNTYPNAIGVYSVYAFEPTPI